MNKIKKVALISGITGQDGSFLEKFIIEKGYEELGINRPPPPPPPERI